MSSRAEQLYNKYHEEFEEWFSTIHPNHALSFNWEYVWDSGWYKEGMAQGAWIAWLSLTGKAFNNISNHENTAT